jgi:hypothetical protein
MRVVPKVAELLVMVCRRQNTLNAAIEQMVIRTVGVLFRC